MNRRRVEWESKQDELAGLVDAATQDTEMTAMVLPFPEGTVIRCFKDDLPEVAASSAPYWTRLVVPDGLPELSHPTRGGAPWCAALMAHYNPLSRRCFVVALAQEGMVEGFLARFPDGIATGGPCDMEWSAEIPAGQWITADRLRSAGCLVLNELPDAPKVAPCPAGGAGGLTGDLAEPVSPSRGPWEDPRRGGSPGEGGPPTEPVPGALTQTSSAPSDPPAVTPEPAEGA